MSTLYVLKPTNLLRSSAFLILLLGMGGVTPLAYSAPRNGSVDKPLTSPSDTKPSTKPSTKLLVMKDALLNALKKHPMTSLSTAHREVGEAYHSQADALFADDPSYNITYRTDQIDSDQGYREFEGSLDFPIWMSGQKNARHKLASSIVSKAEAEQLLLTWEIAGVVLERAWTLRIAQMEVEQAQVQQHSAKKLEADVKRRVQAGEIARGDLILAQQNTAQTHMAHQKAVAEVNQAHDAWRAYTGLSRLPIDLLKHSQVKHLEHEDHPHEIASKARIAAAQASREDVRKQRRDNPTLSLYAKRDRGIDTDPFTNSLGVGIAVPFGTKTSSAPRLAEANASVVTLLAEEAEREREHELETSQAKLAVQNAHKVLVLSQQQNQLAQSRWKLSRRAFDLGESDLFQLLRAREQADIQARALKRSQLELSLSQARLNHIFGAMPL